MKRFKKAPVALLSLLLLGAPSLTSCNGDSSSTTQVEVTLSSIEITKMPDKVDYETGDVFDPTGMEVTAHYSDGSKEVVTDYSYLKMPLDTGQTSVTITYKGKTATVPITVTFVVKCTSIEVEQMPNKTTYVVGETFDPSGMKITGRWTDNTKRSITDYTYDKHDPLTLNDTVVTISYQGMTTTVTIKVVEEEVTGIEVTKNPTKMSYLVGETFDPAGMEVSTVTNKGTKTPLASNEYTIDKTGPLTLEDKTITITYDDRFMTQLTIAVSEARLVSLKIVSMPTKIEYKEGETFDKTGLVVHAVYEDGKENEITDYTIDKTGPLTLDDTEVTISYGGLTTKIEITVKALKNKVYVDGLETIRVEAEDLDTSKATLRDDFIAAGRTFLEAGDGASGGYNICGYNPGSVFEIPVSSDKDFTVIITARMSDTELNYKINDGVQFKMDDEILISDDVTFTYAGTGDYWNWKEFKIAKLDLPAGDHTFSLTAINQRPNLDCFDFRITKYGDEVAEANLTSLEIASMPTKTTYNVGESFDPTGMKIVAKYDDYSEKELTSEEYTIDKTGPLTEADDKVTVSYGGLSVDIPIVVGEDYLLKINDIGNKRVEAESLPTDEFVYRPEFAGQSYVVNSPDSSNGQSIERYDEGSKTNFDFYVGEASKAHLMINLSNYDLITLDDVFTVKLDDQVLTSNNPELGHRNASDFYNWKIADYSSIDLSAGVHDLSIEFVGAVPNLDYIDFFVYEYGDEKIEHELESLEITKMPKTFYMVGEAFDSAGLEVTGHYKDSFSEVIDEYTIDKTGPLTKEDTKITITAEGLSIELPISVKDPDIVVTEAGDYKFEAENVDTSTIVSDGGAFIEDSGDVSSNGKNLGHIAGGYAEICFSTNEEYTLTIEVLFAFPEEVMAKEKIENMMVDGKVIDFEDVKCGAAEGNQYWNYKAIVLNVGKVASGNHKFRINFKGGGNYDYFNFKFSK